MYRVFTVSFLYFEEKNYYIDMKMKFSGRLGGYNGHHASLISRLQTSRKGLLRLVFQIPVTM